MTATSTSEQKNKNYSQEYHNHKHKFGIRSLKLLILGIIMSIIAAIISFLGNMAPGFIGGVAKETAAKLERDPNNNNIDYSANVINGASIDPQKLKDKLTQSPQNISDAPGETLNQIKTAVEQDKSPVNNEEIRLQVKFDTGSTSLTNESQEKLSELAKEIKKLDAQKLAVRVIGHSSKTGNPEFNQNLSQKRAEMVVDTLRNLGLEHKIVAEGKSYTQPMNGIPAEDPRQQRTEIRLESLN